MQIFQLTPKLYINDEPINNLEHELKSQDFKHIFIICSSSGFSSLALNETINVIKKLKIQYFIYQIENNVVDANEVFEASILFEKKKSNLIIAIGGNKTIDFAKILAIYAPNKSLHHSV
ncbi:iron-containing alcohol dehydrogenase [bacterium]|nr:iron-containing alcohol dehydrogenase [bacterium]